MMMIIITQSMREVKGLSFFHLEMLLVAAGGGGGLYVMSPHPPPRQLGHVTHR